MEAALSTASWLLRKLLDKLSGNLVAAFFASSQLGTSVQGISRELLYTQGLLHTAQGSVDTDSASSSNNPGLLGLLQQLSTAADEAEDMLDELDYFLIQDELDGTNTAAMKDGVALHGGHAIHHAFGKWLPCLSCSVKHDGSSDGAASKLVFDRVGMANRITAVMGQMQPLCAAVSDLLKLNPCRRGNGLPEGALKRPMTTSLSTEDKLYGRDSIFDPLVKDMISAKYVDEKLSVLPIVGPGGIGKTTFVQHLYNDTRIQHHFQIKIWICVSVSFNVYRLTQEIFKCVPPSESEESSIRTEPTNLDQLQILLAKWLKPRRFLIVLDDIWRCDSEDEWRSFLAPFTKGETRGNVILTTTRFSCVAKIVKTVSPLKLDGLDPEEFLTFFLVCVFGESKVEHHMDLLNIGKEIIRKLKCSPLAAKTVGRLLRKDLTQEHWRRVLYNEEWGYQTGDNDIMPALKISFDYLPFHLKKCFSYCALFPEDHLFGSHQLIHLWLALGILHNRDKNMRIQEMGLYYINELVNNGFFQKYNEIETQLDYPLLFQKETTYPCYVMHDLFHELARNISSYECISVDYSSSRPMYFPQSIRHLSIVTRQEKDTEAECNDNFKEQMYKLKERIDIGNLRTLMLFGEYNTTFATIFQETFKEINGLRVLSLYAASQDFLPHNFSKLIHLRYLRIQSHSDDSILLPNTLSRFCHLKVLDLEQWEGNSSLPTDMSRLRNLCFFHAGKELHFNIPNVGKLMFLQELKKFHVKKESTGFGLQELAGLKELGGSLTLQNLENVKTKREADEAKLMLKKNITELKLIWDSNRPQKEPAIEADILESLQPHPNIKHLCIKNNGSRDCPTWLRSNICIQMLQSLHLQGISWTRLPPFGQIPHLKKLKLENIACMDQFGEAEFSHLSNQSFRNLKVIVFHSMPEFKKWSSGDYCNLFNGLEALEISKCPKLNELPFTTSLDSTTQDSQSMFWFQNLHKLVIDDCPQLLPLAPLPHTAALEHVQFRTDDSDVLYTNGGLTVSGETRSWEVRSSAQQQKVHYHEYCPMSVKDLQKLIPLKILRVVHCGKVLIKEMVVGFTSISVECLDLTKCCISGKELSVMLNYLPNVSHLFIDQCPNITRMSSKQSEDDKAEDDEGLLQLLPKLSKLLSNISIEYCENLTLCAHHGGIQEFVPLQSLTMSVCEVLFPCWPIDGDIFNPFPSTLKQLYLRQISSMESMAPLSSLTSLTHLEIVDCENVKMDGFDPLILQNLKKLVVYNRDDQYSIAANIMSRATNMILEKTRLMLTNTFKLEELVVDSISAVLLAPLCIHLSDSLHMLSLSYDHGRRQIESFTQEQEQAFLKLTSLRQLHFVSCKGIHSLPVGLQCLPSLEMLKLQHCTRLQELTIENLPSSLQQLVVYDYRRTMKEQLKRLREKFPELVIEYRG